MIVKRVTQTLLAAFGTISAHENPTNKLRPVDSVQIRMNPTPPENTCSPGNLCDQPDNLCSSSTGVNETLERASSDERGTSSICSVKKIPSLPNNPLMKLIVNHKKNLRQFLAEATGTFIIVQLGTGAVMSAVYTGALQGLFQIAAVWIIAVTLAICTTASISGAHLNPAISIAFAVFRSNAEFGWRKVPWFVFAQLLGSVTASWLNYMLFANIIRDFEKANDILRSSGNAIASAKCFGEYYVDPISTPQAFLAEAFGTSVLAAVIFALTHPCNDTMRHKVYIPPFIGMIVGALICVLAPLTQGGFNPARDFGPRIVAYLYGWTTVAFQQAWLYIVAPIVGALLGALFIDKFLYEDEEFCACRTSNE